jgi:hypothetical protein
MLDSLFLRTPVLPFVFAVKQPARGIIRNAFWIIDYVNQLVSLSSFASTSSTVQGFFQVRFRGYRYV